MSPFRKKIAERLVQSQQTAALLTTFNEIDMTNAMALRKEYQDSFVEKYGIKLGFMSFFVKAAIDALKLIPAVNGEIRGTDIVYKNFYDIGVAVGGGKGLAVPVIRSAGRLSFAEVEQTIASYGKRAKDNKLELSELMGGTFTISNGGIYGSLLSTPIVNPPQSGILGLHAIQDRPIALNGQVVIRPMMYIALTYDHRLIDGREAVDPDNHVLADTPDVIVVEIALPDNPGDGILFFLGHADLRGAVGLPGQATPAAPTVADLDQRPRRQQIGAGLGVRP
jgi:2-oxoglutarate dehydrogenase E2 component (dihydrolipoamide succinyltransferase)